MTRHPEDSNTQQNNHLMTGCTGLIFLSNFSRSSEDQCVLKIYSHLFQYSGHFVKSNASLSRPYRTLKPTFYAKKSCEHRNYDLITTVLSTNTTIELSRNSISRKFLGALVTVVWSFLRTNDRLQSLRDGSTELKKFLLWRSSLLISFKKRLNQDIHVGKRI